MPWGDRTGPLGLGPRTGRGLGYCAGYGMPGYLNPIGRGFWRGYGRGFGFRGWFAYRGVYGYPPYVNVDEKTLLREQERALTQELDLIRKRLEDLEKTEK